MRRWGLSCWKLGLALLTLTANSASAERVYQVRVGDTLWTLAQANRTSVQALLELNDRTQTTLRVGEVIRLPGGANVNRVVNRQAGVFQQGSAVYYPGRRDPRTRMTAAHLSLPRGTWVRVTHQRTGRSVDVLINDRGPFGIASRIIDLSDDAARVLGIMSEGIAPVTISILSRP